jgi:hypothetical protein
MAGNDWSPSELSLRERAYGVRHRLRRFRWEFAAGRPLLRWFPTTWFTDPLAMIDICSPWEVAWVTRHMATCYTGTGAVVELGPWLGDITIGMLRGLEKNPRGSTATIDAYDLFVFDDIEQRTIDLPLEGRFRDGDSFLPLYVSRLGDAATRVTPHQGDIIEQAWPADRPIEFLFNDVAKTWEIWNHLKSTFYRSLSTGGTVVEQDWAHACTPWIHLWHHRYRKHFEPQQQVPNAGSVPFRLTTPLPTAAFEPDQLDDYTDAEVTAAFDWAAPLVDRRRQPNVRGAYVHVYTLHGDLDRASQLCVGELAGTAIDNELAEIALPVLAERLEERARATTATGDESSRPGR